jgi:FtsP/CotA-like multicopper oxidase with cupredoxin domain
MVTEIRAVEVRTLLATLSGWAQRRSDVLEGHRGRSAGPDRARARPLRRFQEKYVFHCHNLEHEDMMMANFEVV